MNELISKASQVQEATGLSGPALAFVAALATVTVLVVAFAYARKRRNRNRDRGHM